MVRYLCDYFNSNQIIFADKFDKKGYNILHQAAFKFTPDACKALFENIPKTQIAALLKHETQKNHPKIKDKTQEIMPYAFAVARAAGGASPAEEIKAMFAAYIQNVENQNPCDNTRWRVYTEKNNKSATEALAL
ncbi:MAG: hypothetical protein ISP24_01280 [Rickettsiales bacterium]|nr:hypothetical protein [Rickettsiales bacterium]